MEYTKKIKSRYKQSINIMSHTTLHAVSSYSDSDNLLILADEGHFEWADTFFHDLLTAPEIRYLKQISNQKIGYAIHRTIY
jgi:hypothetical protein